MELRAFAERILQSTTIAEKLLPLDQPATDAAPGTAWRVDAPRRPDNLRFAGRKQAPPMPLPKTFRDPSKRALAHHIMANHELQALEVMAFTLCAFPDAHPEFRLGIAQIMADEQRHTRMHIERAALLGLQFGAVPVNGYFWDKAQAFTSVLDYLAGLPLTFEGGNLDHTLEFAESFELAGDSRSAALMRVIHRDEIEHVRFGIDWLRKLKPPEQSEWDAYVSHLHFPLKPEKSKGKTFHREPRLQAGLSEEFLAELSKVEPTPPDQIKRGISK
ncbi:MAG: hypothetical protein JWN70_6073 [Planctomycetaceae bacterium]|nr:hypothetical protein [Planctomycetaceae bacterium]